MKKNDEVSISTWLLTWNPKRYQDRDHTTGGKACHTTLAK